MPQGPTSPSELLIRQQLHTLARALPAAQKGDAHRLHEARVATRRLRERLPLVLPGSSRRKLVRKVRRLSRALGPARQLDVALQMLDELSEAGDVPAVAIAKLRQLLSRERQRLYADMSSEVARIDVDKLRRRAVAAARKAQYVTAAARDGNVVAAQKRAARRAVRLRAAIDNAAGLYLPGRLHDVRIAVKKLRYALELVRELSGSRAVATIATLKGAQDLLGRVHDLEVLIGRVRAMQGSSSAANLRLSAGLDRLVRRLETECRQLHGHYMALRRKLLTVCERTLTAADTTHAKTRESSAA
ncbi:MAG: CHAD domain-containing protein [Vicinamibacterales bacterium]